MSHSGKRALSYRLGRFLGRPSTTAADRSTVFFLVVSAIKARVTVRRRRLIPKNQGDRVAVQVGEPAPLRCLCFLLFLIPFPSVANSFPFQPFFVKGVNKSIGNGRIVVVLCSLEISFMVWRNRNCNAIGCALIIAAACTSFSAA